MDELTQEQDGGFVAECLTESIKGESRENLLDSF